MNDRNRPLKPWREAAKIAGFYLIVGTFWVLLSDYYLNWLVPGADKLTMLQSYKGWFFVGITASVLYGYNARQIRIIKTGQEQLLASEDRFRKLTEVSPDAILVQLDGRLVYANSSAARLLGVANTHALLERALQEFVEPEFHSALKGMLGASVEKKSSAPPLEMRIRRADDRAMDVQAVCGEINWEGRPAVQVILHDVSELKQAEERLRQVSKRLQQAIEGAGECIWTMEAGNDSFTFSGAIHGICNAEDGQAKLLRRDWENQIHPEDIERVKAAMQSTLDGKSHNYECEYRLKSNDGSWKWVWSRGVVVERDSAGKAVAMTGTLADITVRKNSDELAWRYANLDALTGMPNRRLFHEKLEAELRMSRRAGTQLAILFIDLDGFKRINDLYGHKIGDLLLIDAAQRLRSCVRETDIVARLGGDEFTMALTNLTDLYHAEHTCQKILSSLSRPFHIGEETGYISCSIGISQYPLDGTQFDELIRKADQAMYAAKRAGKNQFHYFTKEMDEKAHGRLRIAEALHNALQDRQLTVLYQPIVNVRSGKVEKAEALLRWHHPALGDVMPSQFIPMAEETGLIKQIGNWAFREAASFCKTCREQTGIPFQISINKSPVQFMARSSEKGWLEYLDDHAIAPDSISIEITEGVLLHASGEVEKRLRRFRDAGMQVALDDFGTGYSSMSYLQKFQIDYVKIDQSFIRDMTSNPSSRTIAETIIVMAHKLGQKVIAEGVETEEQFACLEAAGCDYAQGYLFAPPIPAESLMRMVSGKQRHGRVLH